MGLIVVIALVFLAFTSIQVFSIIAIRWKSEAEDAQWQDLPNVSLLLAARNEEKLIRRSLESISALDYPADKLEVWIGDDDSTDTTAQIVKEYIQGKPQFQLISIRDNLGLARGKANVLAQLAHLATGEFFFITDVDVKLPAQWIQSLVKEFNPAVGIVSGTTLCERGGTFATMQSIDWLHFMGYIKAFANAGISCTTVGNNMAVRASAYFETGGYENLPFSITEDYRLFDEVTSRGWGWRNTLSPDSLGLAWHIDSWKEMLHQRKRWLIGARELPVRWKAMIILYGLFIPALVTAWLIKPELALVVWAVKFGIQTAFITVLASRAGIKPYGTFQLFLYELYVLFVTLATAVFYFLPFRSVWKGRKYNAKGLE